MGTNDTMDIPPPPPMTPQMMQAFNMTNSTTSLEEGEGQTLNSSAHYPTFGAEYFTNMSSIYGKAPPMMMMQ
jgi:hypothetical protein